MPMASNATLIEICGDLDLAGAIAERERLLGLLDHAPKATVDIEIAGERPTQPALQVFFAAVREARDRGHDVAFGEKAAAELARAAQRPQQGEER